MKAKRLIAIHGTEGTPQIHWFPWLSKAIRAQGIEVLVPWFPTPEGQHLDTWLSVFNDEVGELRESDILVGHSVGACFILRLLEASEVSIASAHLVAGFHTLLPDEDINRYIRSFVFADFDWPTIRTAAKSLRIYHSDTDPYVPLEIAQELASDLGVDLRLIKDGGHLNADSGFNEFPYLLESICRG
jgi:hypothetical protein